MGAKVLEFIFTFSLGVFGWLGDCHIIISNVQSGEVLKRHLAPGNVGNPAQFV